MKGDVQAAKLLETQAGEWSGSCRTWTRPGAEPDLSSVTGRFQLVPGTRVLRHTYQGSFGGKPRHGEEWIVFNTGSGRVQTSWVDDFHMNYGILQAEGDAGERGFSVSGSYAVGPGEAEWGWRTVFELLDADSLLITAYNVTPDGAEAKAVETRYRRQ